MKQISLFNFDDIPAENAEKKSGKSSSQEEVLEVEVTPGNIVMEEEVQLIIEEVIVDIPEAVYAAPVAITKKPGKQRGRKSIKEMAETVGLAQVPPDELLFEKRYYSISAVAEMFKENISLIRFWENEFDILKPKKNGKGDRLFRPEDVKNIQLIHSLLRGQKYTIEGAKDYLKRNKKENEVFVIMDELKKIKSFLLEVKAGL